MAVPEGLALALSLAGLAATLAVAVARPRWLPEAVVAVVAAAGLVAVGAVSVSHARQAVGHLAPTIGFLAALLLLADGCRREGLFEALGALMARGSRDSPRRLLALVFAVASSVTVVLGLDPTIVLLTPVVLVTATRLRMSPEPDVYATAHLANSASLLLPISNLTNLLVFTAAGLSFARFAALMLLPTVAAIAVEWVVLNRFFAAELGRPPGSQAIPAAPHLPRLAVTVLSATLAGFVAGSLFGTSPVWIAAAGAAAITVPALVRRTAKAAEIVRAIQPSFLLFVFGLGVIVVAASNNGLAAAVRTILPGGTSLPTLLAIAAISALLANLVNNLPAILIIAPVAVASGPVAVLAALVGVNVGPNLTYTGSLATLLWRRLLRADGTDVHLGEFLRLGAATVPAALATSTLMLWSGVKVGL
jgi:arsenical pump membrane protein